MKQRASTSWLLIPLTIYMAVLGILFVERAGETLYRLEVLNLGCNVLDDAAGLPRLPAGDVVLHTRLTGGTRRALTAAFSAAP